MCSFSTRTKSEIFDQSKWIFRDCKKHWDGALVKIVPQVLENIKKAGQTLDDSELLIKVLTFRSDIINKPNKFKVRTKLGDTFYYLNSL